MSFEVYGVTLPAFRSVYFILAEGAHGSSRTFAEGFLLAPSGEKPIRGQRVVVGRPQFPVPGEILELIDLKAVCFAWAGSELEQDVADWWRGQPLGTPLPNPPEFVPADKKSLVTLWVRGIVKKETIRQLIQSSGASDLRDYLGKIELLPTVERLDLSS